MPSQGHGIERGVMWTEDLLSNVAAAAVVAPLAFGGGVVLDRIRRSFKTAHLRIMSHGGKPVQIILPSFFSKTYARLTDGLPSPVAPNNPFMPMQEALAVARLARVLNRDAGVKQIDIVTSESARDGYALCITVGGPAVNASTNSGLVPYVDVVKLAPYAVDEPPDTFTIKGNNYSPSYDHGGQVIHDHGFIIFRFNPVSLDIFVFGGWSPGTDLALKYLASAEARRTVSRLLRTKTDTAIIVDGQVFGLRSGDPREVAVENL
jgi:hypothetical protein